MSNYSDIAARAAARCGEGCAQTAVKVAACEGGGNPNVAPNRLGCVTTYQWCPPPHNSPEVFARAQAAVGDLNAQVDMFLDRSDNGANLTAWDSSKGCWSASGGKADAAWEDAVSGLGSLGTGPGAGGGGIPLVGDLVSLLKEAMDKSLSSWFGIEKGIALFLVQVWVRLLEIIAGGVILAIALVMFVEVVSTPRAGGPGLYRRSVAKGKQLAQTAAMVAVAA